MKKRIFGKKLSRDVNERRALFRALVRALVTHGEIKTTKAKAKAIVNDVEKLVNLARKNSVAARRNVYAMLGNDRDTTDKLFATIAPGFSDRQSGFTKTVNLKERFGDNAQMVRLSWSMVFAKAEETVKKSKLPKIAKVKKPKKVEAKKK